MAILNLGSCCIDHVYHVPEFVRPGETLPCASYEVHPGGKGLNQSIAIARAGADVRHAGKIGTDGLWLKSLMDETGVDTRLLLVDESATGHANIQVTAGGENAIVLFGGTNRTLTRQEINTMLDTCRRGDFLVLQNEISELHYAMTLAREKGLRMIFNAAPMTREVVDLPLADLELLIINEVEGRALSGKTIPEEILDVLGRQYPATNVVLTLGAEGAIFSGPAGRFRVAAPEVDTLDTTGAGDTFTGFLVAGYSSGQDIEIALNTACQAAAISVTRSGAASSIPLLKEVKEVKAAT
jgi:ribokinase